MEGGRIKEIEVGWNIWEGRKKVINVDEDLKRKYLKVGERNWKNGKGRL